MKRIILLLPFVLFLCACNQSKKDQKPVAASVEQLVDQPEVYSGKTVLISGTVSHVCRHGGQKMFLFGTDAEKTIQVNVGTSTTEFEVALEGTEVEVTGVLNELKIDEAYIAAMEKDTVKTESAVTTEAIDSLAIHQHEQQMKNAEALREKIAQSGKGYISEYWIEATSFIQKNK